MLYLSLKKYLFFFLFFFLPANVKLKPTVHGFPVYQGPIHCFRTVLQKEGIAGIYRGMGAMLLRDVPGYCLYFIPYTFFCGWITPDGCISPNPASIWLAGGVAGKHLLPHNIGQKRTGVSWGWDPGLAWGCLSGGDMRLMTFSSPKAMVEHLCTPAWMAAVCTLTGLCVQVHSYAPYPLPGGF